MDPNACLVRYHAALSDGDQEEADAALEDLRGWRAAGGFPPADGWPAAL